MVRSRLKEKEKQTKRVKFKSLVANKILSVLLNSPLSGIAERILVWLGHKYPYNLPGRGAIINQLALTKSGVDLVANLICGGSIFVSAELGGVSIYFTGSLLGEEETNKLLSRVLRERDVFFDIGANLGVYTIMAALLCGHSGHVYAFEVQPVLVEYLLRSVALNGYEKRVTIEQAAVVEKHGSHVKIFFSENRENTGIPSVFSHEWLDVRSSIVVPTVSMDGYLQDNGIRKVNVVKMDIEGAEVLALRGMQRTLKESPPELLIVEVSPPTIVFPGISDDRSLRADPNAAKPQEVVDFLRQYGYEPRQILRDGQLGSTYTTEALQTITCSTNVAFVSSNLRQRRPDIFVGGE